MKVKYLPVEWEPMWKEFLKPGIDAIQREVEGLKKRIETLENAEYEVKSINLIRSKKGEEEK